MSPCPSLVALLVLCGSGNRAARDAIIAFVGWGLGTTEEASSACAITAYTT
jgi:hypothetical protein